MLRKTIGRLVRAVTGKSVVRVDKAGYKFYTMEPMEGSTRERRMVEPPDHGEYRRDEIHKLWHMWISHTREEPPTDADIKKYDDEMAAYKLRVEKVEEEDRKLRIQEQMELRTSGAREGDDEVTIAGVVEALKREDEGNKPSWTGEGGKFKPEGWKPKN